MGMTSIVVIFRVKGGDVYEVPVVGVNSYRAALRVALGAFGLNPDDVILCRS